MRARTIVIGALVLGAAAAVGVVNYRFLMTQVVDPMVKAKSDTGSLMAWRDTTTKKVASLEQSRDSVRVFVGRQTAWDSTMTQRLRRDEQRLALTRQMVRRLAKDVKEAKLVAEEVRDHLPPDRAVDRRELSALIERLQRTLDEMSVVVRDKPRP